MLAPYMIGVTSTEVSVRLLCSQGDAVSAVFIFRPSVVAESRASTVYVPIEARYPIEARPPFREQKLHANVYICNKMESLSNQNDI